jgi:uncharacterized protein (TIGR02172 family)
LGKGSILSDWGRTAQVLIWGNNQMLKLFREGFTLSHIKKEEQITRTIFEAGFPVPAVHGIIEVEGRYGILFDRIIGPSMGEEMMSKPRELMYLTELFAELQAKMHAITVTGLPSQHKKLESQIQTAARLSKKEREAALSALTQLPEDNTLCHGDFHPGNILMSSQGPVVIDCIDASQGNAHADVARTLMLLQVAELDVIQDVKQQQAFRNLIQKFPLDLYFKRYQQFHRLSQEQLDAWKLPVAAARLSEGLSLREENRLLEIVDSYTKLGSEHKSLTNQ